MSGWNGHPQMTGQGSPKQHMTRYFYFLFNGIRLYVSTLFLGSVFAYENVGNEVAPSDTNNIRTMDIACV